MMGRRDVLAGAAAAGALMQSRDLVLPKPRSRPPG